jgi:hypothetical protein
MSTQTEIKKKTTYPIYEMPDKGKIILTQNILMQIVYLHSVIGKTEWSGILLYDVISGNPSKPSEFVLKAKHIFLMDIGTITATSYDTNEDIVDIYDNIEGSMEMKIGHIHSHHNMNAFFSGTDNDELMENVDKHNYYVSLIVNFSGNYACKVAFLSETKNIAWMHYTDDHGELKKFKSETVTKQMIVINMNIAMEYDNDFFFKRLDQVKKKIEDAKKKQTNKNVNSQKSLNIQNSQRTIWNSTDETNKEPDPTNLTNSEVEKLTRNILTLNSDLEETRSVYTLLMFITDKTTEEEFNFYCEYLEMNIELVIEAFFGNRVLTDDELTNVIKEVKLSINRFYAVKQLTRYIKMINESLDSYLKVATQDKDFDAINEAIKLDEELKTLVIK